LPLFHPGGGAVQRGDGGGHVDGRFWPDTLILEEDRLGRRTLRGAPRAMNVWGRKALIGKFVSVIAIMNIKIGCHCAVTKDHNLETNLHQIIRTTPESCSRPCGPEGNQPQEFRPAPRPEGAPQGPPAAG